MEGSAGGTSPHVGRHAIAHGYTLRVEVRSGFDGAWCRGYSLEEVDKRPDGSERFKVRRLSDGTVVPDWFEAKDVIVEGLARTTTPRP